MKSWSTVFILALALTSLLVGGRQSAQAALGLDREAYGVWDRGGYVRHPMYAMMFFMWPSIALELGSWWALLPAAVIVIVFVIRTALEDRTLQAELPGYTAFALRVRYPLVPGVW